MNDRTKVVYNLARMYEYVNNVIEICAEDNFDYKKTLESNKNRLAINMCIVEIGEHCGRIRDIDNDFYENSEIKFFQIKGMRDRIVHSYGHIDYNVVSKVLKEFVPDLKKYLEVNIHRDILENPYALYEEEYDDYLAKLDQKKQQNTKLPQIRKAENHTKELESDTDKELDM